MDVAKLTLERTLRGLRHKEFSAHELVQALLDAIARHDPTLQAYNSLEPTQALQAARAADAARAAGTDLPLLGLPIAIKDMICEAHRPCTCSSRMLADFMPPYDATVITRLKQAGAFTLGRTTLDELAMGTTGQTAATRRARNPHDPTRTPGGSSSGSAAAVAGGIALAALGSDTGGSIRQPAAYCGCVGLKPSYGRVSRYGVLSLCSSTDQVGTLTRSTTDAALLLQVLAGYDAQDGTCLNQPLPDYRAVMQAGVRGLRIGVPQEYFSGAIQPAILSAVRAALDWLANQGAEVHEISLPHTTYATATYQAIMSTEASSNLARLDGVRYGARVDAPEVTAMYAQSRGAGLGLEVKQRLLLGTHLLRRQQYQRYLLQAQKVRTLIKQDFNQAWTQCDVLLTPVTPQVAPPLSTNHPSFSERHQAQRFTVPASLAGLCALALPCGQDAGGLPLSLQLLGAPLNETMILRVAYALEQERAQ